MRFHVRDVRVETDESSLARYSQVIPPMSVNYLS